MQHPMIRTPLAADSRRIAALMGELGYPALPESMPSRLEAMRAEQISIVLLSESQGVVNGLITAHSLASIHDDQPVAWITTLVVDTAARGSGVGRRLVEAAERWGRERGCVRISVTTALHRAAAHAFYERLGYQQSGRRYSKI